MPPCLCNIIGQQAESGFNSLSYAISIAQLSFGCRRVRRNKSLIKEQKPGSKNIYLFSKIYHCQFT